MNGPDDVTGFDPNGPGLPGKLFGLPFTPETARVVILPVPWEVTVSYHTGTARGPKAVQEASRQIDLFHLDIPEAWKLGAAITEIPDTWQASNDALRVLVDRVHQSADTAQPLLDKVNEACGNLNIYIKNQAEGYLAKDQVVGLLGGDHSTALGLMRALAERHDRFGILQIDAHADLRKAYEGFQYSHGSIMYNALKMPAVSRLVQVGIRDLCEAEYQLIQRGGGRIRTFFDEELKRDGRSWTEQCKEIVDELPEKVYISFDIDGLDPQYCPNTGTPVPGGLDFFQAVTLIRTVALSGRTIIGFDLSEVAPGPAGDWDANVGARMLWQLTCWTGVSRGWLQARETKG